MVDIIKIFEPTVALDEMTILDKEFGSGGSTPDAGGIKFSKLVGDMSPYIIINGMRFFHEHIVTFELDVSRFLPMVTVVLKEIGGLFVGRSFPTEGDVMSVYIKSSNKDFKPVRQDYRIYSTETIPGKDPKNNKYVISASLNIPDIYTDKIASFPSLTSLDVLKKIAEELKLGFATNETGAMDDSMTWVCPCTSYYDFINNDLMVHAYKDDNSFYVCFIDQYYFLNFVEVNSLITLDMDLEKITTTKLSQSDYLGDDVEINPELSDFFLSNIRHVGNTPNQVKEFSAEQSASGFLDYGYRAYLTLYDNKKEELVQYYVEPMSTEGTTEDYIILKGRDDEDHTQFTRMVNFVNIATDNVHKNFYHSLLQNDMNGRQVSKVNINVLLSEVNPAIYRYKVVPLLIVTNLEDDALNKELKKNDTEKSVYAINKLLSGYYFAAGIQYVYSTARAQYTMYVRLAKREFDIT